MLDVLTKPRATTAPAIPRRATASRTYGALVKLSDVSINDWSALMARAMEPNAFYHPGWARAVSEHAHGQKDARALLAYDENNHLVGLLPVQSAWRALALPIPALVSWQAYAPLTTPLLDRDCAEEAAGGLLEAAAYSGARAVLLTHHTAQGKVIDAFHRAARRRGTEPHILGEHRRALFVASGEDDRSIDTAVGAKKLKELRRQRNRLADDGHVALAIATHPREIADALEEFLALEAEGWKGRAGTALALDDGDAKFIREATRVLADTGHCRVAVLTRAGVPVAAGVVLHHLDRAYFFKLAYDESLAKLSPGVQLTLELTRHFASNPDIADVDSIADADHPMIDHLWRDRLTIATTLFPTRAGDALARVIEHLIVTRGHARNAARTVYHALRNVKEHLR
jgi:CelD/BcsL family acetyltransferase involved in cellulose biosynthesis